MLDNEDIKLLDDFADSAQSEKAFRLIIEKYQVRLYWHIRKMVIDHDDTDDILQNTMIKAWKGLPSFQRTSQLYTWLYRIATNETLSFLQQKKKRFLLPLADVESQLSSKIDSDPLITGDEIQIKLQKAILRLPEKQRLVFNMRYFDEIPYEDMSEILGTSEGALKASYHHAVKKIEKFLEHD
jgi:RNA polymerase sigma-70 factor (ECF subfamily)